MDNINSMLPPELFQIVFNFLPPQDLKAAMLVCKSWSEVVKWPKFWAWVCLKVTEENLSLMPEVLGIERLKSVEKLSMTAVSEELLLTIEEHPGLKVLDAKYCRLSHLETCLLARVVAKLEEVDLSDSELTTQQCEAIFRFAAADSNLKKLDMTGNDLSSVEFDPESFAKVVAKLEELSLSDTELTAQQCQVICRIAAGESKLKKLNMNWNNLSSVDPETLARAISKLEEVDLDAKVTTHQCEAIFRLAASDSKIKKLKTGGIDLSSVSPNTLANVVAKLEEVQLRQKELTTQQCEAIFRFAAGETNLKKLDIAGTDLSSVDPETLARVVAKLEEVNLCDTELTRQQCEAIFRFADFSCSKLKNLNMTGNDLTSVDLKTLERVVDKLEDVNLSFTNLGIQQEAVQLSRDRQVLKYVLPREIN